MKVAESLNSLNSDGFLEVCKRVNELSRLDEYKSTQKQVEKGLFLIVHLKTLKQQKSAHFQGTFYVND